MVVPIAFFIFCFEQKTNITVDTRTQVMTSYRPDLLRTDWLQPSCTGSACSEL